MNEYKYEKERIGTIVIVRDIIFFNEITGKYEVDHAFQKGRPCLILYSDEEYDYFLSLTSRQKGKYVDEYYPVTLDSFHYVYCNRPFGKKNPKNDYDAEYINVKNVYKKPICGYKEVGKLNYKEYKKITKMFKNFHEIDFITMKLDDAILIRK